MYPNQPWLQPESTASPVVFKDITIIDTDGSAVALFDYDYDGSPDIFVSNWGKNRLYHHNHNETFTDVAERAGVALGNCEWTW